MLTPDPTRSWCILRTAGRATLRLAKSLAEDGFECWTPKRAVTIRKPRWNVRKEVVLPLMPSFVFASREQMADLIGLAAQPRKEYRAFDEERGKWVTHLHPDFSLFRHAGRIPIVEDCELGELRRAEQRAQPVRPAKRGAPLAAGTVVRVPSGSFQGMSGIVEKSDDRYTLVCFATKMSVKISTFILQPDESYGDQAVQPMAA